MALIEFANLAYGYTDERVIVEASGALHPGNIIGLVGPNGGGKTTLLRLLLGELSPEQGRVQRAKAAELAYVSQTAAGRDEDELFSFVRSGRAELCALEREIGQIQAKLATAVDDQMLLARLGKAQQRFAALGGHRLDHDVRRLLLGLSFAPGELYQKLGTFSGGQRQKACLGRALLSDSNTLVFDEPTNHLDLAAQDFFVEYVKGLPPETAVVLVSHDRWLLDALGTHIWELEDGVLYRYKGNYSAYVPARELRRKHAREAYARQQEHISRTEEYIRRNIAGQNTRQARGRRTLLARMERIARPADDPDISFVLKPQLRSGEQLLLVEDLAFAYDESVAQQTGLATHIAAGPAGLSLNPPLTVERGKVAPGMLLGGLSLTMYRGERLGLVGPNGCGKTTLLNLLARQLVPVRGMVAWGANVELGIYHQDSADLGSGHDLINELRAVEPTITDSTARAYLARFGFSGDDVFDSVDTLSGGERSRLSLAKIFRRRPNTLLLDEPTNHLDIYAREALEQFLTAYEGSVIIVTHDRALLERLCNRLVIFERVDSGQAENCFALTYFAGSYRDYLRWRTRASALPAGAADIEGVDTPAPATLDPAQPELLSIYDIERLAQEAHTSIAAYLRKQGERAQRRVHAVENKIEEVEGRIRELATEQREADRGRDYERLATLQDEIEVRKAEIDALLPDLENALKEVEAWERLLAQAPL